MADGAFSEKPKSKREQAVEKALDVLIAAGISAAIIGATWPEADEDGNKVLNKEATQDANAKAQEIKA
jgi:hypothetical protein